MGSRGARHWDRLATRLSHLCDRAVISGALVALDRDTSNALLTAIRRTPVKAQAEAAKLAR